MIKEFKLAAVVAAMAAVAFSGGTAWAAEHASKDEAVAMVKKAVAFINANGKEKGYAAISNTQGQFRDRDLYVLVVDRHDGHVYAHGANPKLVGKGNLKLKDVEGKLFVQEMVDAAKAKNGSWTEYKYTNPVTKKVETKDQYCERLDDSAIVCGGAFKG